MSTTGTLKPITVPLILSRKGKEPITVLTAYDFPMAQALDEAGIEILLVGDSLGTVLYGYPNTIPVTMDDMIRHTSAVAKATKRALVVVDMPFMSYQVSREEAITNAGRLIKESGAQAVKLEGGTETSDIIRAISRAGIPVMAHIGLTPQSIHAMGTYRTHGKVEREKQYLLDSAYAVSEAGAFSVVLECVEEGLASHITNVISIPTIGIGSGPNCDGQVLVSYDLFGFTAGKVPKFVEPLADVRSVIADATKKYIDRVKAKKVAIVSNTTTSVRKEASKDNVVSN